MKRLICLLFIINVILLCACRNEYNILSYQEKNITANCTVNDKYNIEITKNESGRKLTVLEPENLCGIAFEIGENTSYAIKDSMKIPLNNQHISGIFALSSIFSLKEGNLATVTENNILTFKDTYTVYTVTYGENNLPLHIEISGDKFRYSVNVNSIKFN